MFTVGFADRRCYREIAANNWLMKSDYGYDAAGRINSIEHSKNYGGTALFDQAFTWDAVGNETQRKMGSTVLADYTYDAFNRMKSSTAESNYAIDKVNNWSKTGYFIGADTTETYKMNQYAEASGDSNLAYDLNGNLTAASAKTMVYNAWNEMVSHDDGVQTTYRYDALGRRIEKSVGGTITRFYYSGSRAIEERDGSNTTTETYVYGNYIDEVVMMQRGGSNYYCFHDDMFNVMKITDGSGNVVEIQLLSTTIHAWYFNVITCYVRQKNESSKTLSSDTFD